MLEQDSNYYYVKLTAEDTAPVGTTLYRQVEYKFDQLPPEAAPVYTVLTTPFRDVRFGMSAVMEDYAHPTVTPTRGFKGLYIRKVRQPIMYQLVYRHGQTLSLGPMKDSLIEARDLALSWRGGTCTPIAMMQRDHDGIWRMVTDYANDTGKTLNHNYG